MTDCPPARKPPVLHGSSHVRCFKHCFPEELARLFGNCAWFGALDPAHQQLVLATSRAEHVQGGAWIARRNAPSDHWLGVHSGLLKLAIYNESGRSCTFSGVRAAAGSGRAA